MREYKINELNDIPMFFIVGRGRSGTTMLQNILDSNENVILPLESKLIIHLKKKYFKNTNWHKQKVNEFLNDLYKEISFNRTWGINIQDLKSQIERLPKEQITFEILCKLIYLNYKSIYNKKKVLIIGDKNPSYSLFIKDLIEIFPQAKFIHLLRDYRDNILSNIKTLNDGRMPISSISFGWVYFNKLIEKEKKKIPNSFLTIKYEDLVSSPEDNVKSICSFLNIEFDINMLNFSNTVEKKIDEEFDDQSIKYITSVHPNLVKPISTKYINKWQKALTQKDLLIIEYIASSLGENYNYFPSIDHSDITLSIRVKSKFGILKKYINLNILRYYYKLPFFVRDIFTFCSLFLYKNFNYTNFFNNSNFNIKGKINRE